MSFAGKNILITGASAGIGQEFAKQLYQAGANLILVARRKERLHELSLALEQTQATAKPNITILACDLTNPDSAEFQDLISYIKINSIDILINNAGCGSFGYFEELPLEQEIFQIRLNVEASTRLAHAVIPQMKKRKAGGLINVSSIAGLQSLPYMATYSGTKAFNLFQALSLWYELKPFNVHVMAVCPGPVKTEFGAVAKVPGSPSGATKIGPELVVKKALADFQARKFVSLSSNKIRMLAWLIKFLPMLLTTNVIGRLLDPVAKHAKLKVD